MEQQVAVASVGAVLGFAGLFSVLVVAPQLVARRLRRQRIERVLAVRWTQRRRNGATSVHSSDRE